MIALFISLTITCTALFMLHQMSDEQFNKFIHSNYYWLALFVMGFGNAMLLSYGLCVAFDEPFALDRYTVLTTVQFTTATLLTAYRKRMATTERIDNEE